MCMVQGSVPAVFFLTLVTSVGCRLVQHETMCFIRVRFIYVLTDAVIKRAVNMCLFSLRLSREQNVLLSSNIGLVESRVNQVEGDW